MNDRENVAEGPGTGDDIDAGPDAPNRPIGGISGPTDAEDRDPPTVSPEEELSVSTPDYTAPWDTDQDLAPEDVEDVEG